MITDRQMRQMLRHSAHSVIADHIRYAIGLGVEIADYDDLGEMWYETSEEGRPAKAWEIIERDVLLRAAKTMTDYWDDSWISEYPACVPATMRRAETAEAWLANCAALDWHMPDDDEFLEILSAVQSVEQEA